MLLIHAATDSFIDHLQATLVAFASGGVAMRYLVLAARALPEPLPMGSRFYLWLYKFCQISFANPDLADKAQDSQQTRIYPQ